MTSLSPSLSKRKTHRSSAPAKPDEEKKARKPAYLKRGMAMSQPQDQEEQEADQVAREVRRAPKESETGPQEDKEMVSSKPVPSAQRLLRRINRMVARQVEEEEEEMQLARLQRKSARLARQEEKEEEEEAQPKLRRKRNPPGAKRATLSRSVETEDEEKTAQTKLSRIRPTVARQPEEEEEEVQTKLQRKKNPEEEQHASRLQCKPSDQPESAQQPQCRVRRAQQEEESTQDGSENATAAEAAESGSVERSVEERINASLGRGDPLPESVLRDMEKQFGQDLSGVTIHNDTEAAELCKELNARAFTVGRDIYFGPGEFAPESDSGRELLAHEMTHVVQQSGSLQQKRKISRQAGSAAGGGAASEFEVTEPLEIPPIKSRHGARYQAMARAGTLRRSAGGSLDRHTAQRSTWMQTVQPNLARIPDAQRPTAATGYRLRLNTGGGSKEVQAADEGAFLDLLKIPTWDNTGADATYQVDHIVEFQLGGPDAIDNMELLNSTHNGSVGSSFRGEIRDAVRRTIDARPANHPSFTGLPGAPNSKPTATDVLEQRTTKFKAVAATGAHQRRRTEGTSTFWSRDDIQNLAHVLNLLDASLRDRTGTATQLSVLSPTGGLVITKIPHGSQASTFPVPVAQQTALSGFRMVNVQLDGGYNTAAAGARIGAVNASLNLGPSITVSNDAGPFAIDLLKDADADFAARISSNALANLPATVDLQGASPVDLSNFSINRGLMATAMVRPTHPLLAGLQLPGRIENGRLGLFYTLDATTAAQRVPLPGVTVTDATVTLGYDGENLSAGGLIEFSVRNFGDGTLSADLDSQGNFGLEGRFNADTRLFDQAVLQMWYRSNGGFGVSGTLGISSPDKIKGIRSASITASYAAGNFSASGDVQPDIPGVQQAGLSVAYSEAEGLTIGGNLQLSANPAIRSGSIDVTLNKQGEAWKVRATGTAQPAIPGIDSQLSVTYDDGAFTAEFSGGFTRGRLSGTVTVGATNRAVGEDGRPSGDPLPGGALNIYGRGSATIQIASWLQGTAGIRFDPNGEVTVSGEIGIPSNVEIFARREINKSLFSIAVQVPIVPGIVAEVGGGLTAVAGIGPGVIDRLTLGITYNPAHEENTRVTGDAHLRVPADAGLRLSVRAGIGLGITGASATGGLEIGGTLGIEGAAEAGVHIDWTPTSGLDLTANLSVHAQPSFTFDISGYVAVTALGFSVYDKRWQFASYRFGSDYRFGISLPVHYHEGEPFNISLDDVQFEVPQISPGDILSGLISRIA
ncbi:MAG: DUF4157 domain-containing protein [Gammaproteobacteria bacterium]|nr:DUF4157 domain-containing protein [Gammaproteobacteria bacterium]